MAWAIPHKGISADGGSGASNTFTLYYSPTGANTSVSAIASGNAVVGFVVYTPSTSGITVSAVDSATNTVQVPIQIDGTAVSGAGNNVAGFYLQNITNSPTSITFTASGANTPSYWRAAYIEVSGMLATSPLDAAPAINAQPLATTTATDAVTSAATGVLATSGELVYGFTWTGAGPSSCTITQGTNFLTQNVGTGTSINQPCADEVYGPIATGYASTVSIPATFSTNITGSTWITGVMTFKLAPVAAGLPPGDWIMLV